MPNEFSAGVLSGDTVQNFKSNQIKLGWFFGTWENCQGKAKSATSLVAHQAGAYLRLLLHEAARSISTPPGWDASPSQGYPQH